MENIDLGAGSADQHNASGDADGTTLKTDKKDMVSYESHQKLLGQLKKAKEELGRFESLKTKLSEFELKQKQTEEQVLAEKGEWSKLLELKERELQKVKTHADERASQLQDMENMLVDAAKLNAFRDLLPGSIRKPEYMRLIQIDKIVVNPETKEVDADSVKTLVNDFVTTYPELIVTTDKRLPNGVAAPNGRIKYNQWLKLPLKEKKLRAKDIEY